MGYLVIRARRGSFLETGVLIYNSGHQLSARGVFTGGDERDRTPLEAKEKKKKK